MSELTDYSADRGFCRQIARSFCENIRSEIQDCFPDKVVVAAGGCIRDVAIGATPKDYDIFILGHLDPDSAREEVCRKLEDSGFVATDPTHHSSEPFLAGTFIVGGLTVQVMASKYSTIEELIDSFDWNVSRYGWDGERVLGESILNIARGKPLLLHKVTFPLATLRRGFRFSERFGMTLSVESVIEISKMIINQHEVNTVEISVAPFAGM